MADYPDPNDRPPRRRERLFRGRGLMGAAAAGVVLAVFAGIVWHAYDQGREDGSSERVPLIRAGDEPIKVRPDDPGGMDVPHRDKLIYNRLDPESEGEPVESLLPPPERPLVPEIETPPPRAEKPSVTVEVPEAPVVPPTGTTSPPVASEPKPAPAPSVVAPPPMSSDTGAAGGARIQLSSVRSREAALDEWSRLSAANSDLLSDLRPHVEEATITGRGTFYRLQAGPFASRDAAAKRCDRLRTRKIACFAVVAP